MNFGMQHGGLALAGALAAVAPIILHLILKQKPKEVVFPALRLLRERRQRTTRKLRLRHLLLLALRIAALAALGFALARPSLKFSGLAALDQDTPIAAFFVIDTSPSMQLKADGKTRLEAAKELARQALERLPDGSDVVVIDSSEPAGHAPLKFAQALPRLEKLEVRAAQQPLERGVEAAVRGLAKSELKRGEIYVVTDGAAHAWNLGDAAALQKQFAGLEQSASVYLLPVGAAKARNVSLGLPKLAAETIPDGGELRLKAMVRNQGPATDAAVELLVDGEVRDQRAVKLGADQAEELSFVAPGIPRGVHQATVRLKAGDTMPFDDERYATFAAAPPAATLAVAPTPADAANWANALEPAFLKGRQASRFTVATLYAPEKLAERDLTAFKVVALLNVGSLPDGAWRKLRAFADGGGGIFVAVGNRADPAALNREAAQSVLPGKLLLEVADKPAVTLLPDRFAHPILKPFETLGRNDFARGYVVRHWRVALAANAQAVVRFSNGDPGLAERGFGAGAAGKCVMLCTAAHYEPQGYWSELPRTWSYVMLAEQTARYLAGAGETPRNVVVGASPLVELPAAPATQLLAVDPAQEIAKVAVENAAAGALRFPAAKLAGHYQVTAADGPKDFKSGYSANIPEFESALDPLDGEKLREALGKERTKVAATLDEIQRAASSDRVGRELFPILALLVLAAISVETWVANRFYEQAPPAA